jgi:CheY-like chemotaxis protein
MVEVKVYLECSLCKDSTDKDHAKYVTELCNSLSLLSKYILDQDNIFKPTVHREECGLFITDCFETSGFCADSEVKAGLEALFDFRWSGNTAVAIAFSFLHEEPLRFGCFKMFSIDIFQVPYACPELSHCICIGNRTIDGLVLTLQAVTKRTEHNTLPLKREMLALDLWPSLANRIATHVLGSLTGQQGHNVVHGSHIPNELREEINKVLRICSNMPEFNEFLSSILPLIVALKDPDAAMNRGSRDKDMSDPTIAGPVPIMRRWPLGYAIDSLYRMGQSSAICQKKLSCWPEYSFVVEDERDMAMELESILKNLGKKTFQNKGAQNAPDNLTFNRLRKWILGKWKKEKHFDDAALRSIVLMDLEIGSTKRGLDFVRRLKEEWPDITCLVISGFEEEVENAFSLGADGYIIKPFESDALLNEIERLRYIGTVSYILDRDCKSQYLGHMTGVCSTATDPNETNEQKWDLVIEGLRKVFACRRIKLQTTVVSGNRASLSEELADEMVADAFLIDCEGGLRGLNRPLFVDIARMTKLHGSDKSFTILLPSELMHQRPIWLYRYLRDTFCEEKDRFQHKPVFRFPFTGAECTLDSVYNQITLKRRIKFDVRYSILFPLEPVFGRFEEEQLENSSDNGRMFVIPLINAFGFSVSIDTLISAISDPGVVRGQSQRILFETITREIRVRRDRWTGFWEEKRNQGGAEVDNNDPQKFFGNYYDLIRNKLTKFAEELKEEQGLLTFESWIRRNIDKALQKIWKNIWSKFGGDTKIELFLRGDWLNDEGKRIEDIHTLVYILTRYAPMNRRWLEENVIGEIKRQLGEEQVFLQEERVRVYSY